MMKQEQEEHSPQRKKKSVTKVSFSEESDNQVYRIPRLSFSRHSDCFYNDDEIADFRYDAFLLQAGILDPEDDDDDEDRLDDKDCDDDVLLQVNKNRNDGAAQFDVSSSTIDTTVSDLTMSLSSLKYQHLDDDDGVVVEDDEDKHGHKEEVKEDPLPEVKNDKQKQVQVGKKNKALDRAEDDAATVATVSTSSSWSTRRSENVTATKKKNADKSKNESDRPIIVRKAGRQLSSWKGPTTSQSRRSSSSQTSSSASTRTTSTKSSSTSFPSSTRKKIKPYTSKSAHTDGDSTNKTLKKTTASHKDPQVPSSNVVVEHNKIGKMSNPSTIRKSVARSSIVPTSSWKMVVKPSLSKAANGTVEKKKKTSTTTMTKKQDVSKTGSYLKKRISSSWKTIEPKEPFTTMAFTAPPSKVISFEKKSRSVTTPSNNKASEKAGSPVSRGATRKSGTTATTTSSSSSSTDTSPRNKKPAWQLREEAKQRKHRWNTYDEKITSRRNKVVKQ